MAEKEQANPLSVSVTRNGHARKKLAFIPETAARFIYKYTPLWFSNPNLWTLASAIITPLAVIKSTLRNIRNPEGINLYEIPAESGDEIVGVGGSATIDMFDGSLAREKNLVDPGSHDTRVGGSNDSLNDRWGNFVLGISRTTAAFFRGDKYGVGIATASTIARAIPAWQRSREEAEGRTYPESGNGWRDPLGFLGTHGGSTPLSVLATLYPKVKIEFKGWKATIAVQNIVDTITFAGAVTVIFRRTRNGTLIPLPDPSNEEEYKKKLAKIEEIKGDAEYRKPRLVRAAIATGVIAGGLGLGMYFLLSKKRIKSISGS